MTGNTIKNKKIESLLIKFGNLKKKSRSCILSAMYRIGLSQGHFRIIWYQNLSYIYKVSPYKDTQTGNFSPEKLFMMGTTKKT